MGYGFINHAAPIAFGFDGQSERGGELFRQICDVDNSLTRPSATLSRPTGEGFRLPLARTFRERLHALTPNPSPIGWARVVNLGGVSVVGHWFAFSPLSSCGW